MTSEELDKKMEAILEENNLDWQSVHLWIMNKGYVIITEGQYNNLEVIDQMDYRQKLEVVARAINRLTDDSSVMKLTKNEKEVVARFLQNKMEELNELVKDK
jgi:hypothetical protein